MYYCKKCSATVKIDDTFCPKCFTRLNDENRAYSYGGISSDTITENSEFSADDLMVNYDLSGSRMFGYRLINKICTLFDWHYYSAKMSEDRISSMIIAHKIVSNNQFFDLCYLSNTDKSKNIMESYTMKIIDTLKKYSKSGRTPLLKDIKYLKSDKYQAYHIFLLLEDTIPLVEYYSNKDLSIKEIAKLGLSIVNKSIELNLSDTINDTNIFINSSNEAFFLGAVVNIDKKYFVSSPYTIYNSYFETPYDSNRVVYSIGVILYKMLNEGKNPFQVGDFSSRNYLEIMAKKSRKIVPSRELLMNYPIGKIIEYSLSNYDDDEKSIYTLKTLLEKYII